MYCGSQTITENGLMRISKLGTNVLLNHTLWPLQVQIHRLQPRSLNTVLKSDFKS